MIPVKASIAAFLTCDVMNRLGNIRPGAAGKMPPRLGKGKSTSVRVVVTEDFLKRLDEWRRTQPDLPNRSEALRRMAELVLAVDVKPSRGKPLK